MGWPRGTSKSTFSSGTQQDKRGKSDRMFTPNRRVYIIKTSMWVENVLLWRLLVVHIKNNSCYSNLHSPGTRLFILRLARGVIMRQKNVKRLQCPVLQEVDLAWISWTLEHQSFPEHVVGGQFNLSVDLTPYSTWQYDSFTILYKSWINVRNQYTYNSTVILKYTTSYAPHVCIF